MTIGIYFDNSGISAVDLTNPENGNPGIGGSEYMLWMLACYYTRAYKDDNITVYVQSLSNLPSYVRLEKIESVYDAIEKMHKKKTDIFVSRGNITDHKFYKAIESVQLKTIMWTHNFEDTNYLSFLKKCPYVLANVCVSREQLTRLVDTNVYNKSTFIYNALDFTPYKPSNKKNRIKKSVTYIGSLVPIKGFHILAAIWPKIEKKYPQAELHVIGSGDLYNRDAVLGEHGFCESGYENLLFDLLKGTKNVKFHGLLGGVEKINVMKNSTVGIVNPSGRTETFCLGAVEFEALGVPVVTKKWGGLLNTIDNSKTGYLVSTHEELLRKINLLLENEELVSDLGGYAIHYSKSNFDINKIIQQWNELFRQVHQNNPITLNKNVAHSRTVLNILRIINGFIKKLPLLSKLPSSIDLEDLARILMRKLKRL